jgi:hypothetical protein
LPVSSVLATPFRLEPRPAGPGEKGFPAVLNNLERIFDRAKKAGVVHGNATLAQYKVINRSKHHVITSLASVSNQPVDFPSGAIIIAVGFEATKNNIAADNANGRGSLDCIRVSLDLPSKDATLTAGDTIRASALCGRNNERQWPEKEVYMPRQGSINYTIENITTSSLDVDITFSSLELVSK